MMNYRNIQLPSSRILEWGKQGENKATRLSVDVSEFIERSEGTIAVSCCRPDGKKYPHDCTINDTTVEIELSSYDTQVCGILTIVVSWMCGERIVKSEIYCGEISRSISTSGEKPTPPFDGLIEQVCNAAIKTKESADRAEAAAERAENAGGITEETDPTVPAWAKQPTKPSYTAGEVNARPADWKPTPQEIGAASAGDVVKLSEENAKLKGDMAGKLSEPAEGLAVGKFFRVAAIDENGHAVLEVVDAKDVGVQDVQVVGASVVENGVANVPIASADRAGVVSILNPVDSGIWNDNGALRVSFATDAEISTRFGYRKAIVCANLDTTVKAAMCDGKGAAWTSDEQKAARERMGVDKPYELIEEIVLEEGVTEIVRSPLSFSCTSVIACTNLPIMDNPIEYFMMAYTDTDISYVVGSSYGSKNGLVDVRFEESIKNGVLTGTSQGNVHGWGGGTVYGVNNAATLVFCEALIGVRLYTPTSGRNIPAGTKIKIYGVRA